MSDSPRVASPWFPDSFTFYNANAAANLTFEDSLGTALRAINTDEAYCLVEGHLEVLRLALISIGAPVGQQGGCSPLSSSKTSLICTPVPAAPETAARGTSSLAKGIVEKKKHGTFLHVSHPLLQNGRSITHSTHSWCTRTPARCCARINQQACTAEDKELKNNGWEEMCYEGCEMETPLLGASKTPGTSSKRMAPVARPVDMACSSSSSSKKENQPPEQLHGPTCRQGQSQAREELDPVEIQVRSIIRMHRYKYICARFSHRVSVCPLLLALLYAFFSRRIFLEGRGRGVRRGFAHRSTSLAGVY